MSAGRSKPLGDAGRRRSRRGCRRGRAAAVGDRTASDRRADGHEHARDQDDRAPVAAVGEVAADQHQRQRRDGLDQAEPAERQRIAREVVGLERDDGGQGAEARAWSAAHRAARGTPAGEERAGPPGPVRPAVDRGAGRSRSIARWQASFQSSMTGDSRSQPRIDTVAVASSNSPPDAGGQADPARGEDPQQVSVRKDKGVAVDARRQDPGDDAVGPGGRPRRPSRRRPRARSRSTSPGWSARISAVVRPSRAP